MLWGLAALAAPILIHFWNQKKAINVDWAAMKWLQESQKLKAKGFRFEDLLLLLLRALALILLVLALSKPLLDLRTQKDKSEFGKIHVLANDKATAENFKFEINEALTKKEPVYWLNNLENRIDEIDQNFAEKGTTLADIQKITRQSNFDFSKNKLILYLPNDLDFGENPNVFLPENITINLVNKSLKNNSKVLKSSEYIFVDDKNQLTQSANSPDKTVIERTFINVALASNSEQEKQNLKAALEAIKEVYGFPFIFESQKPEIVIGNLAKSYPKGAELIIQTDGSLVSAQNVITINQNLDDRAVSVFRAELPEQILEIILNHYQITSNKAKLSSKQLNGIFREKTLSKSSNKTLVDKYLYMLLLCVVMAERWISLKYNK